MQSDSVASSKTVAHRHPNGTRRGPTRPARPNGDPKRPSERVIAAVADAVSADPVRLGPLYDRIDPEVIDQFVTGPGCEGRLTFRYAGHAVTVSAEGHITLDSIR